MTSYVELSQIVKTYPGSAAEPVIDGFDMTMSKGEFVALIGHSGCGKSTLLAMLAGLTSVTSGVAIVAGREVTEPGPDRAVVFQAPCLLPWLDAFHNVALGVDQVFARESPKQRRERATEALATVGLGHALERFPAELSSGMQQRVGIARALALEPKMLLLDEPFGMLDSLTRMELQEVLLSVVERVKTTTMLVTHDVDEALFLSDRVVMMTSGPHARVGGVLRTEFSRPRRRTAVVEAPEYYEHREALISFLEAQEPQGTRTKERERAA